MTEQDKKARDEAKAAEAEKAKAEPEPKRSDAEKYRAKLEALGVDPDAEGPVAGPRRLVAEVRRNDDWIAVGAVPDNPDSIDRWHERFKAGQREGRIRVLKDKEKEPPMQPWPARPATVVGDVPGAVKPGAF